MRHDNVLKKLNYDLLTPPHMVGGWAGIGGSVDLYITITLLHPLNLKKLNFDFLTQTQGRRDGVCGKNMFYYVAAFVIPLNLICNMTMF